MARFARSCLVLLWLIFPLCIGSVAHAEEAGERPDQVRLRGGFSLEGAAVIIPGSSSGGAVSAVVPALHLGVQINHLLGVYYENHPLLMLLVGTGSGGGSLAVGFADLNNFIASVTLFDTLELGGGGGFDFYALAGCGANSSGAGCGAGTVVTPGLHGKAAVHLGGWSGTQANRSGFSIQLSFHASIDPSGAGVIMLPMAGIGGEWF
jgi:hypothetical protein